MAKIPKSLPNGSLLPGECSVSAGRRQPTSAKTTRANFLLLSRKRLRACWKNSPDFCRTPLFAVAPNASGAVPNEAEKSDLSYSSDKQVLRRWAPQNDVREQPASE